MVKSLELWLEMHSRVWTTPVSGEQPRRCARAWIQVLGDIPVRDVKPIDIQRLYLARDSKGKSSTTVNKERKLLSGFFSWAIGLGLAETNPVTKASWPVLARRKSPRSRQHVEVTRELLERILDLVPPSCRRLILFLYLCGLRIGEGLAARYSWILEDDREPGKYCLQVPDTRKQRTAYILPLGEAAMRVVGKIGRPQELIFDEAPGRHRVELVLRRAGNLLGIQGLTPHSLRRSCATALANAGAPLPAVQRFLGWRSAPAEWLQLFEEHYYQGLESNRMRRLSDRLWDK